MTKTIKEIEALVYMLLQNESTLNNLKKYYEDIISATFINDFDFMNIDTYLEYMDYFEYTKLISENRKRIMMGLKNEISSYHEKVESLKQTLSSKLTSSSLNIEELNAIFEEISIDSLGSERKR